MPTDSSISGTRAMTYFGVHALTGDGLVVGEHGDAVGGQHGQDCAQAGGEGDAQDHELGPAAVVGLLEVVTGGVRCPRRSAAPGRGTMATMKAPSSTKEYMGPALHHLAGVIQLAKNW